LYQERPDEDSLTTAYHAVLPLMETLHSLKPILKAEMDSGGMAPVKAAGV